jgi:BolA protein
MSPAPELTARRIEIMQQRLEAALQPEVLEIVDESHHHVGHAGARDGRGHFKLHIVSAEFAGLSPLQRHRLVYAALGELMQTDIHALAIEAEAP